MCLCLQRGIQEVFHCGLALPRIAARPSPHLEMFPDNLSGASSPRIGKWETSGILQCGSWSHITTRWPLKRPVRASGNYFLCYRVPRWSFSTSEVSPVCAIVVFICLNSFKINSVYFFSLRWINKPLCKSLWRFLKTLKLEIPSGQLFPF